MPIKNADTISQSIGCVPCLIATGKTRPCQIHHPFGRKGDNYQLVYGSCPFHHQGHIDTDMTAQSQSGIMGPSIAWGRKHYRAFFGNELGLLRVQKLLLDEFAANPWLDYDVPHDVRQRVMGLWLSVKNK
jgi:hypothetical protein